MSSRRNLTKITSRLTIALASLVALATPVSYFGLSYQHHSARMQTEAGFYAASVSRLINAEPDWWEFQDQRLAVLIERIDDQQHIERRTICDAQGQVIIHSSNRAPDGPFMKRSADLLDSGNHVGKLVITRSLKPLLANTLLAALAGTFIGGMIYFVLTTFPLRALKQTLLTLDNERERAQITLHSIGDAVITTNLEGRIDYMNPTAEVLTGSNVSTTSDLIADEILRFKEIGQDNEAINPVSAVLKSKGSYAPNGRATMQIGDDQDISVEYIAEPIRNRFGKTRGVVLTFRDVTKTERLEQKLSFQATHDELTGLINRRAFQRELHYAINSARRDHLHHVLLYIDLDQFKVVNDTSGHGAGDELLRLLTKELSSTLRRDDTLARLGGDEFGVLLKGCPLDKGEEIADTLVKTVRNFRFKWHNQIFTVGASIGVAGIDSKCAGLAEILSIADAACYAAKDRGRNRTYVYRNDDSEMSQRRVEMRWVSRITRAIDEDHLRLYYQTILPLKPSDTGCHFEILVRMIDNDGKLVPPNLFIPAAESYGLMPDIDKWVIEKTFAQLAPRYSDKSKHYDDTCCINLSGTSWADETLSGFICEMVARYRVPARMICFELTETAAINNIDKTELFIRDLKEIGFRFALDDFGAGANSFSYLKRLPVDYLKIDGSFVTNIIEDKVDYAMVEAINHVGHIMEIETIAEFVENDAILEVITDIGIDKAQGYGISKPQPFELTSLNSAPGNPLSEKSSNEEAQTNNIISLSQH